MELINAFIFFLIGVVVGVSLMLLRNRLSNNSNDIKNQLEQYKQENAQVKQEWQDQLISFKSISNQLNELSGQIDQQVSDAQQVLHKAPINNAFPFFSKEATDFLQNSKPKKRGKELPSDQPLDYSNTGSGVFKGISPEKVVENK